MEEAPNPGPPPNRAPPSRWQPPGDLQADWGRASSRFDDPTAFPTGDPDLSPAPPAEPRRRTPLVLLIAVAGLAALVGGTVSGLLVARLVDDSGSGAAREARPGQLVTVEQTSAVANAASQARASVVRIESTRRVSGSSEQDIGSGVVLDNEGHVVTNAHVVLGTDTLKVILADGTERPAVLLGHDYPFTDVAVLQIGPGNLEPIASGDSAALKLGETVVAIGNPLAEFDGSVSVGVISGLDRARTLDGVRQTDLIQTDAAVNNGNSGGALVNLSGQFVGMPTAVIRESRSGTVVEGIAFALPSNRVLEIATEIIRRGRGVARPSLQADHVDLTDEVLSRLVRPQVREGALITAVIPGGAASTGGIQPGDVVTELGGNAVDRNAPLYNALVGFQPGTQVRVVLNRNGRIIETEVRLAERP